MLALAEGCRLVSLCGRLHGAPEQRTDKNGHAYAVAKVRAIAGNGAAVWISVIAFDDAPAAALLGLSNGDSVALCGELTPMAWVDKMGAARPSLDLIAHQVLSEYHVNRRRKALEAAT
jgi:hypothetical protein